MAVKGEEKDKVKGNPIYIPIGTEILSQMIKINKDPNSYF